MLTLSNVISDYTSCARHLFLIEGISLFIHANIYQIKIKITFKIVLFKTVLIWEQSWFEGEEIKPQGVISKASDNSYSGKHCHLCSPCALSRQTCVPSCIYLSWDIWIWESILIFITLFLFWLVTSKGNSVSHMHAIRAVSTQAAREVRRAHGLRDFRWNTIQKYHSEPDLLELQEL